jgi:iron complex outermembrane receptor protein
MKNQTPPKFHHLRLLSRSACAVALLCAATASAQVAATPGQPPPAAAPTASPSPSPTTETETVERIVVTANKREENIQEVPSSVSAINDVELENLHATQLTNYAPYIPGLQVNSGGAPGETQIALRGLAALQAGSSVATYVDETPVGSSGLYQQASLLQLDLLPYDIRRVEILRGPQGTLYGANSIGGLVKYVTLDPSLSDREFRFGGGVSGTEGSDDLGWDVHLGVNLPLITDQLGVRASYSRNELPGYIDNAVNGAKDINSATQQSALFSTLWQPNDVVSLRVTALGQKIESDNNGFVALDPATRRPLFGDLTNEVFVDEPFTKKIGLLAATLDVNLGWATITSATGYSNTKTDQRLDATTQFGQAPLLLGLTVTGISGLDRSLNLDKFTQELRLTSKSDGPFLWQLGAFFTYERADQSQFVFLRQLDGTPFTGANAILNTLTFLDIPSTYTEYAGFANASYNFTDRLSLGAGLRLSHNEQDFAQNVTDGILLPIANTPGSSDESVVDFMVTPKFKIDDTKLLYVRIASGYQPGGPNVALGGVPPSVDATTALSYEGGLKSEFLDHRLLFNIAGYHIDLSDIQIATVVNNVSALVNGGEATSNGLEFTVGYQPIRALSFAVTGAYTDATLSDDAPSLGGRAGDRLPNIPEFSGSFTADYFFPLWGGHYETVPVAGGKDGKETAGPAAPMRSGGWNGHLGLGVRYVGETKSEVESSPNAFPQDSYAALDLAADVSNGPCTIRIFARNVTDNRAYETVAPISNIFGAVDRLSAVPIQPRTIGIEFDFRF